MHVYKQEFKNLGGYLVDMQRVMIHLASFNSTIVKLEALENLTVDVFLTQAGEKKASYVKLKRVENFILSVGAYEDRIFKKRTEIRERRLRRLMEECKNKVRSNCCLQPRVT